jgi:NRAMP (natural resistance-associated macrophage protein)-like metal ion transporter
MKRLSPIRRRLLLLLAIMGPGVVSASAGNDAGGIATYTAVGAHYGFQMLWMLVIIAFSLAIVQEMCARMGAVTGKGLSDLIREQFGVRWTFFAMIVLLIANAMVTVSEFSGIAAAMELFGVSRYLAVPVAAIAVWFLVTKGSYARAEKVFIVLALFQWAYVLAGAIVKPDWAAVAHSVAVPSFHMESGFILLLIGAIGTTIAPWMQFYLQSSVVDKGITVQNYGAVRTDVRVGALMATIVEFFIIVVAGATLYTAGISVETPEDAAMALAPLAGQYARLLFSTGLLGASFLAACILPLSTAYAVCEAFGLERGIDRTIEEAPAFYTLFAMLILFGAGVAIIPGTNLISIMLFSQQVNGILLPIVLVFMLLLVNNRRLMGKHVNTKVQNILGWGTAIALIVLTALLMLLSAFSGLLA